MLISSYFYDGILNFDSIDDVSTALNRYIVKLGFLFNPISYNICTSQRTSCTYQFMLCDFILQNRFFSYLICFSLLSPILSCNLFYPDPHLCLSHPDSHLYYSLIYMGYFEYLHSVYLNRFCSHSVRVCVYFQICKFPHGSSHIWKYTHTSSLLNFFLNWKKI